VAPFPSWRFFVLLCLFLAHSSILFAQGAVTRRLGASFDPDISRAPRSKDDSSGALFSAPSRDWIDLGPQRIVDGPAVEGTLATPIPTPSPTPDPVPTPLPTPTALPTATVSPSPTPLDSPLPTATVFPSPTPVDPPSPTPSIAPTVTPTPSIHPTAPPIPQPTPAFPVPPPNPAPALAMPAPPAPAPASSPPSLVQLQQLTPTVEIWRPTALSPELTTRRGDYLTPVSVAQNEILTIRLQFGLLAIGKTVVVTSAQGAMLDPPQQVLVVQSTGDCAVSVALSDGYSSGAIKFYCQGITTTLPLLRAIPTPQPSPQRSNGVKR
jgi:hypothetical protein